MGLFSTYLWGRIPRGTVRFRALAAASCCAFLSAGLAAQNKSYCVGIDYSKVPTLVNYETITVNVNVGACSSVSVTANGAAIPASYNASTQVASFSTTGTAIVVTALNWTSGGTGAATKATLYNNYQWAYSQTFDDVRQTQYDNAKPLLDGLGLKAGLSAVVSWLESGNNYYMTWAEIQTFRADGWDIYNHTWDHPDPVTCGTWVTEFGQNETAFQAELPGYNVSHSVFPYEVSVATCAGYPPTYLISGELDDGPAYTNVSTPLSGANTLTVARNGIYGIDGAVLPAIEANCSNAANAGTPSWVVYITHSVTAGDGAAADEYSTNVNTLTTLYNYLLTNWGPAGKNTMWFAPAGRVQDYLFTRDNCVLSVCALPSPTPTPLGASPTKTTTPSSSPSPSPSPSPSRTATSSPSASPTRSSTPSASASPTGSSTASASPTRSPTSSATASSTGTVTPPSSATVTVTPSFSASVSPSRTSRLTPGSSATASPVDTPTLSFTASPSATPSFSPSSTATSSFSPTATESATSGATLTSSPSASPSPSVSLTPSATVTGTGSPSVTVTRSFTPTPSPTVTTTKTATADPTPAAPVLLSLAPASVPAGLTATVSVIGSGFVPGSLVLVDGVSVQVLSRTATVLTVIVPALPAGTATVTVQNPSGPPSLGLNLEYVAKATATATAPAGGVLVIERAVPVPNPDPGEVAIDLAGPADSVTGALYSVAYKLVRRITWGPQSAGWDWLPLAADTAGLPPGLYYLVLNAQRSGAVSSRVVVKLYLLY